MSGHSKWAGIKHKKAIVDAKRGQIFTKVARELAVAAAEGGADPGGNFRLRLAIQKAKEVNMPSDNIDRAIARGAGGKDGQKLEEIRYEGYGPHGVAVMVDVLTDNRNRTVASVRNLFTRSGGSLGESNSVGWMFRQQGILRLDIADRDPEEVALEILEIVDVGDDGDVVPGDGEVIVITTPSHFEAARGALEAAGLQITTSDLTMNPSTEVVLDAKQASSIVRLLDGLEELDDVQNVYANADIPDEVLEFGELVRVLGVDPGLGRTGIAVVDGSVGHLALIHADCLETSPSAAESLRLVSLLSMLTEVVRDYQPDVAAVETMYFSTNRATAMAVAQARGVILCALGGTAVEIAEYAPNQVKEAVAGSGGASKPQVARMAARLLGESPLKGYDDVADACAIAICHHHRMRLGGGVRARGTTVRVSPKLEAAVAAARARLSGESG